MATVMGVFPADILLNLIAFNYAFKVIVEIVLTPLTVIVIAFYSYIDKVSVRG